MHFKVTKMSSVKSVFISSNSSTLQPQASTSSEDHVSTKSDTAAAGTSVSTATVESFELLEGGSEGAENVGAVPDFLNAKWDPDDLTDTEVTAPPSPACIRRIKK